jgi:signal transduction histidine kinase
MLSFQTLKTGSVGLGGITAALLGRSLSRLSSLVGSSMAEVRLKAGIRAPEVVSVHEFVEEIEVGVSIEALARILTLAITPVKRGIEVFADRQLLAAAVGNLLQNAFKFPAPRAPCR